MSQIIRKNLAEEVAARLLSGIAEGTYKINSKLPVEAELMTIFGVGRSTVREAIKILTIQGLLDVRQGAGTFVTTNQVQESLHIKMRRAAAKDIYEVRGLLEGPIAEKAAMNRSAQQLKTMKKWLDQRKKFAQKNDIAKTVDADINFHMAIAGACGNDVLADIYHIASQELNRAMLVTHPNTNSFKETQSLHEALLAAIETRQPKKASAIVTKIITG